MSMHLEGPWLSTTGKKKGKVKFRSAEEKRRAEQLDQDWKNLKKKWDSVAKPQQNTRKSSSGVYTTNTVYRRDTGKRYESLDTGHVGAVTINQTPQYTGTKILGIGTMHKSNAVPIFNDEQAQDIAKMRR